MGKSNKTRMKLDPKKFSTVVEAKRKKEKDWTFEDVLRSKLRGRR